jgi:hypothetical protein
LSGGEAREEREERDAQKDAAQGGQSHVGFLRRERFSRLS